MNTLELLRRLIRSDAELVLIGGMAGIVHGSSFVTRDVDACVLPSEPNVARLLGALEGLHPRDLRDPARVLAAADIASSSDASLMTDAGRLDIVFDVPGVGAWPAVRAASEIVSLDDGECRVLTLRALIASKRALGRTRDLLAVEELEAILQRRA